MGLDLRLTHPELVEHRKLRDKRGRRNLHLGHRRHRQPDRPAHRDLPARSRQVHRARPPGHLLLPVQAVADWEDRAEDEDVLLRQGNRNQAGAREVHRAGLLGLNQRRYTAPLDRQDHRADARRRRQNQSKDGRDAFEMLRLLPEAVPLVETRELLQGHALPKERTVKQEDTGTHRLILSESTEDFKFVIFYFILVFRCPQRPELHAAELVHTVLEGMLLELQK